MNKKTVKDIDLKGKKVFVRCDFNVPMDENQNITDNARIVGALPTIKYLLEQNCKIILASHLGRPKGEFKPEFSLAPVAKELSKLLGQEVIMAKDVIGEDAMTKSANLKEGEILLLENVRFHKEETDNDPEFSKKLASMAEVYVNDAFGTAHRAHSSTTGIASYLPAVSGFLIEKELKFLGNAVNNSAALPPLPAWIFPTTATGGTLSRAPHRSPSAPGSLGRSIHSGCRRRGCRPP